MKPSTAPAPPCLAASSVLFAPAGAEPARQRLLLTALRLFADHGYAKTSIRRIASEAGANVAAVSYYFGSKAGLYQSIFWGDAATGAEASAHEPCFALDSLDELYRHILEPLKNGELARYWTKLHRREMLEPTGLWQEMVDRGIQPTHAALVAYLCRRLGIAAPDDEVHALAMLVIGPAVHLLVNCEMVDALAPQLIAGPESVDLWRQRLVRAAEAVIAAERERRQAAAAPARRAAPAARKQVQGAS